MRAPRSWASSRVTGLCLSGRMAVNRYRIMGKALTPGECPRRLSTLLPGASKLVMLRRMDPVTQVLKAVGGGDPQVAGRLMPLVYDELRRLAAERLAHEKPGQTLQATALVHEAYLRLVGDG